MDGALVLEEHSPLDMATAAHIANGKPAHCELLQYISGTFRIKGLAPFRTPDLVSCFTLLMNEVPVFSPNLRWVFTEASSQWVPWVCQEPSPSTSSVLPAERGFSESPLTSAHRHST